MYNSPTLCHGSNCRSPPSTYNSVFATGRPIGAAVNDSNCSSSVSSRSHHTLQPTTASVGPYSLTKLAAGSNSVFQRRSSVADSCSPPSTSTCAARPTACGRSTYCNASRCAGVSLNSLLSPTANNRSANCSISRSSSASSSTLPPTSNGASNVVRVASKLNGELTTDPSIFCR